MASAPPPTRESTIYLGDHLGLTKTRYGVAIYFDTRDAVVGQHVALDGDWEPWVSPFLLSLVRPGDVIVDIGSNIGFYTLHFAQRVGNHGHVHGFEANPTLLERLRASVEFNSYRNRVTINGCAVSDRVGEITFHYHPLGSGAGNVRGPGGSLPDGLTAGRVPSTTLDAMFGEYERPVRLLHMDIETAEPLVIAGAPAFIARNPEMVLVFEVIGQWFRECNDDSMRRALEYLQSTGRRLAVVDGNQPMFASIDFILAQNLLNVLAIPNELVMES